MIRARGAYGVRCAAEMEPLQRARQVKRPNGGGDLPPMRLKRMRWRSNSAVEKGKGGVPASHWESEVSSLETASGVVEGGNRRTLLISHWQSSQYFVAVTS
jgi:hypothetical protein